MAQTVIPKIGWAFYIGLDGSLVPALSNQAVIFVERASASETQEQATIRVRTDPSVVRYTQQQVQNVAPIVTTTPPTDNGDTTKTAIVSTTPSTTRKASLIRIGVTRDKTTRETRLMFDNLGGAAALKWIVTDLLGKRIPGAGWADQAIYQPGLTDFLPFAGYTSSARLSPAQEGVASLVAGQTYLVGLQITNAGVTENYTIVFPVPTESTPVAPVPVSLPPLEGTTPTEPPITPPTTNYTPEGFTPGTVSPNLGIATDEKNNPVVEDKIPTSI